MTLPTRSSVTLLSTLVVLLATAASALAQQSAVVGQAKSDGTFRIYYDRFLPTFADGTPVARIEIKTVDGFTRVYRWAADGCRGESTLARLGDSLPGLDWVPVLVLTSHPLEIFTCEDNGCAATFTNPGIREAKCQAFGDLKCVCVTNNLTGDAPTAVLGDYCKRRLRTLSTWDLAHWVLPAFIK
jgi:hypothetical protein